MAAAAKKPIEKQKPAKPVNAVEARKPVAERGLDLLNRISNEKGMYLTRDEGQDIVTAGHAELNNNDTQNGLPLVTLTNAGRALFTKGKQLDTNTSKTEFEIDDDVPMAEKKRSGRARGSKYPFDTLKPNQSFHVPKTADMQDPSSALASSLTGARRRYSKPMFDDLNRPVMETVKLRTYQLDAKGKRVKGTDGHWIVTGETQLPRQKVILERDFQVVEVGAEDKRGPGARVYRVK